MNKDIKKAIKTAKKNGTFPTIRVADPTAFIAANTDRLSMDSVCIGSNRHIVSNSYRHESGNDSELWKVLVTRDDDEFCVSDIGDVYDAIAKYEGTAPASKWVVIDDISGEQLWAGVALTANDAISSTIAELEGLEEEIEEDMDFVLLVYREAFLSECVHTECITIEPEFLF